MTKDEIINRMEALGFTRQTLAEATGYKYEYIRNSLTPTAPEPSPKFVASVQRAFSEEERRREVDLTKPGSSVWDLVYFNGHEMEKIDRAKKNGGYHDLPTFYRDAVIDFADRLLAAEAKLASNVTPMIAAVPSPQHWIDKRGGVAAGSPIDSVVEEPIPAGKEYPADHYALQVFGRSMEPKIPDGSIIVVQQYRDLGFPRKGTIVVYSDGTGSTLKEFGYRKAKPGEEADAMGNVPVLRSINKAFPDVKTLEGGQIQAVFVEIVSPEPLKP